ncbi:MAG TPA: hypothetical protein VFV94_17270 [Polyangiaceae bacterium]|nr:hypothetical protein [Polyangiaceae bacterium]
MSNRETELAHGRWRELPGSYDDALARLPEALKAQGFGARLERALDGLLPQDAREGKRA